jgi:hypothetical protein
MTKLSLSLESREGRFGRRLAKAEAIQRAVELAKHTPPGSASACPTQIMLKE